MMNRGSIPLLFVFNYKIEGFRGLIGTNKKVEKVLILHESDLQYWNERAILFEVYQNSKWKVHLQGKRSQWKRRGHKSTAKKSYIPLTTENNNNIHNEVRLQRLQQQGRERVGGEIGN
ncbi:hypothetical protein KY290_027869 [Solanum tuberosum]|uniref:Uncharacterized protein n=1 Tax=Solanum tuberosum TaxID=4113 RepID=A0ABQ7UGD5_SOLTU|nr:hypothetical protein KY290_027869 [Solanum tuberosum]